MKTRYRNNNLHVPQINTTIARNVSQYQSISIFSIDYQTRLKKRTNHWLCSREHYCTASLRRLIIKLIDYGSNSNPSSKYALAWRADDVTRTVPPPSKHRCCPVVKQLPSEINILVAIAGKFICNQEMCLV